MLTFIFFKWNLFTMFIIIHDIVSMFVIFGILGIRTRSFIVHLIVKLIFIDLFNQSWISMKYIFKSNSVTARAEVIPKFWFTLIVIFMRIFEPIFRCWYFTIEQMRISILPDHQLQNQIVFGAGIIFTCWLKCLILSLGKVAVESLTRLHDGQQIHFVVCWVSLASLQAEMISAMP